MSLHPFTPGATVALAATDASSRAALGKPNGWQLHVSTLPADDPVYIKFGDATVVAAVATSMRINPGQTQIFTVPASATHCAAICASTETAALSLTSGMGD